MQVTIFIPILTLLALVIKAVFGIEIGEETIEQVADLLVTVTLGIITLVGIFKTYAKKIQDVQKDKPKKK